MTRFPVSRFPVSRFPGTRRQRWWAAGIAALAVPVAVAGIVSALTSSPAARCDSRHAVAADLACPGTDSLPTAKPASDPASPTTASAPVAPSASRPAASPAADAARPTAAPATSPPRTHHTARTPAPSAAREAGTGTARAPGGASSTGRLRYGHTSTGTGTFYGATGAGNCSYEAGSDRMIVAMNHTDYDNSQACGAYLVVTGPRGTSVTVKVVDQCPECQPGDLDLSQEAFAKLANPSAGRIPVSWKLLSPSLAGPIGYRYKAGSTRWWCGIQVRNHRNPVRSLQVRVGTTWKSLPRMSYNYFLSADGTGCGSALRVTDIYGHQLVDSHIAIIPNVDQPGHGQFAGPP